MQTTINKTIGIGDAGWPFDVSIEVEYEKQYNQIIVTDWMEDKSPYDNPPQLWYERMKEIISDFFYDQDKNKSSCIPINNTDMTTQTITRLLRSSIGKEQNKKHSILIATSAEDIERLESGLKVVEAKVEKLMAENSTLKSKNESLLLMLAQACCEIEGIFRSTGEMASVEIATEYTVWARYLEVHYNRKEHFVYEVQDWIEGHNV